tara:strand:- start:2724 stop:3419 length:696 start_codon:yes stop_codon:yes gene_type:complete
MRATDFINIYLEAQTDVEEGVNDPHIFKAVFMAGGPGSGKSYVAKTLFKQFGGLKQLNSDTAFEILMSKAGLSWKMPDDEMEPRDRARAAAKGVTAKQDELYKQGRLGMVIDGTGREYDKIAKMNVRLQALGYDTAMIFVNTDIETALARNARRDRTVPPQIATDSWKNVQQNIGRFQQTFGQNMLIVDNSENSDVQAQIAQVEKTMRQWLNTPPRSRVAQQWMQQQREQR